MILDKGSFSIVCDMPHIKFINEIKEVLTILKFPFETKIIINTANQKPIIVFFYYKKEVNYLAAITKVISEEGSSKRILDIIKLFLVEREK